MNDRRALIQFSVVELIVVLTTVCLVVGSIWTPWIVVSWIFLLVIFSGLAMFVVACLAHGDQRAFAIGFSVLLAGYISLSLISRAELFQGFYGHNKLPTTALWEQAYEPIKHLTFKNEEEGTIIAKSLEPTIDQWGIIWDKDKNPIGVSDQRGGGYASGADIGGTIVPPIRVVATPSLSNFLLAGEVLWMLLFAYLGGKFAVGFQRFQNKQETSRDSIE